MAGSGGERREAPTRKWPGVRVTMYSVISDIGHSGRELTQASIRANVNRNCFEYRRKCNLKLFTADFQSPPAPAEINWQEIS